MFNFGHSCGTIMGVIAALGYAHTMVTPQKWKKAAGLIGTEKDAARARGIQLWPHWSDLHKKGKGQALADAALIARFGA
jgi:crossover junction endodeoxyribonuclease RuvC